MTSIPDWYKAVVDKWVGSATPKQMTPEEAAEMDRRLNASAALQAKRDAEFYEIRMQEYQREAKAQQRTAARRAMLNSSPPPGCTEHPWSRGALTDFTNYPMMATSSFAQAIQSNVNTGLQGVGLGNAGFGPNAVYNSPYAQQAIQSITATAYHGLRTPPHFIVIGTPVIPKPPPEFMETYFDELERAREARVVEET